MITFTCSLDLFSQEMVFRANINGAVFHHRVHERDYVTEHLESVIGLAVALEKFVRDGTAKGEATWQEIQDIVHDPVKASMANFGSWSIPTGKVSKI